MAKSTSAFGHETSRRGSSRTIRRGSGPRGYDGDEDEHEDLLLPSSVNCRPHWSGSK